MDELEPITKVCEVHVDLLLLEELHTSPSFRGRFIREAHGVDCQDAVFVGAWHSQSGHEGESDIVMIVRLPDERLVACMIENKVDAIPQPEQAARYRLRGERERENGRWHSFKTIMVAPSKYLAMTADASGYDVQISYETVRDWINEDGTGSPRSAYRSKIIDLAIEKCRRRSTYAESPVVTQFFDDYVGLARQEFPLLSRITPERPSENMVSLAFVSNHLNYGRTLTHLFETGMIVLHFKNALDSIPQIRVAAAALDAEDIKVEPAGKMARMAMRVPKLNRFRAFADQADNARVAMAAASRLLACAKLLNPFECELRG